MLEALTALTQYVGVRCVVGRSQGFDGFPDRHVEENSFVVIGPQVGGISSVGLQAPDESRAPSAKLIWNDPVKSAR